MPRTKNPPTTEKPTKVTKSKVVKKEPVAVKVAETVVAAPVETAPTDVVPAMTEDFTAFMTKLQQVNSLLSSLRTDFRALEKKATRELKAANKANQKRKRKQGNRSPSGFVKPTLISNELAAFLGKDKGSEMARTEVTREINAYIRKHSLQDKTNGRKIIPDAQLAKLLKLSLIHI